MYTAATVWRASDHILPDLQGSIWYVFYTSCTEKVNLNAQRQNGANRSRPALHDAELATIEAQFAQREAGDVGEKEPQQLTLKLSHVAAVVGRFHFPGQELYGPTMLPYAATASPHEHTSMSPCSISFEQRLLWQWQPGTMQ